MTDPDAVTLDGDSLTVEQVVAVARDGARVTVAEDAWEAVRESRERVEDVLDAGDPVYGVNTGFGELVDTQIPADRVDELQTNLVRSHAAGADRELDTEEVRAMMLTRINALVKGYSGIRAVVVETLLDLLNAGVHPVVRSRGSLGASGDLAPLAHMSLVLLGEGEAMDDGEDTASDDGEGDEDGERLTGAEALDRIDRDPLTLRAKEGLALINGTQLSVGLAALAVHDAERLCRAADVAGGLTTEVTMGTTANCIPAIQNVRPHTGQAAAARNVTRVVADSPVVESHRNCDRVQDAYAIRCLPQVHGAVRDAVTHLRDAVETELNSATDNPLVFPREDVGGRPSGTESAAVVSGGNFHGEPLALRLDYATSALTELAAISERRVDRMVNPNLQEDHLPPFLTADSGAQSGYMIPQYTAAALLNECRSEGRPSTDNTPVSGGQEDHVSMSATSAYALRRVVERARTVVAVELLCGAQAAEFVDADLDLAAGTDAARDAIREAVPPLTADRPHDADMETIASLVADGAIQARVNDVLADPLE